MRGRGAGPWRGLLLRGITADTQFFEAVSRSCHQQLKLCAAKVVVKIAFIPGLHLGDGAGIESDEGGVGHSMSLKDELGCDGLTPCRP